MQMSPQKEFQTAVAISAVLALLYLTFAFAIPLVAIWQKAP
jgi:hypothetical protein